MLPMILAALAQSAPQLLQGIFGNSGDPSRNAGREYFNYYNKNMNEIGREKDPTQFINHLMSGYNESPWAKNERRTATNEATNAASASGLTGSTPLLNQIQQNSSNIASADQDKWLQNVLGINKDYLDRFTNLNSQQGKNAANASYGQSVGQNYDRNQLLQGITQFLIGKGGGAGAPAYSQQPGWSPS